MTTKTKTKTKLKRKNEYNRMKNRVCRDKKRFSDHDHASQQATAIKRVHGRKMRVYFCNFCDQYHLTSTLDLDGSDE